MLKKLYPKRTASSAYIIDYDQLYKIGYRGIIFDVDNTLVEHDADADERSIALIEKLTATGFSILFMSNNNRERVERFNKDINVEYIYDAHKPLKKHYLRAMKILGTDRTNTLYVGDQLFTDILGANYVGIMNYLVKSISPKEEAQIVFKRRLEKVVLMFYKRYRKRKIK